MEGVVADGRLLGFFMKGNIMKAIPLAADSTFTADEQAAVYFERIRAALPDTAYAASATKWLATKSLAPREAGCLGCHVAK